jgi:hypothetical protein
VYVHHYDAIKFSNQCSNCTESASVYVKLCLSSIFSEEAAWYLVLDMFFLAPVAVLARMLEGGYRPKIHSRSANTSSRTGQLMNSIGASEIVKGLEQDSAPVALGLGQSPRSHLGHPLAHPNWQTIAIERGHRARYPEPRSL